MKVITTIPDPIDERFKSWRKAVESVDLTQRNGYAFQGEFLRAGRRTDLEVGTFALLYDEHGTHRYHPPDVRFARLDVAGNWVQVEDGKGEVRARALAGHSTSVTGWRL